MDRELEHYLESVHKCLKGLSLSEKVDIISELRNYMMEVQSQEQLNTKEILAKLGSPKELAAGYLGDKIKEGSLFGLKKVCLIFSFYTLTSLTGMVVIPCGTVLAGGLLFSGIIAPVGGLIDLLGYLFGYDVPFVGFQFGDTSLHPFITFPLSVLLGGGLFLAGRFIWKVVIQYIKKVIELKDNLITTK